MTTRAAGDEPPRFRIVAWTALVVASLAALGLALGPAWYIQPFRAQSTTGLDRALAIREVSPLVTAVLAVLAVALVAVLFRSARSWRRITIPIAALPVLAATAFAQWNHFEAMFAPLDEPQFASAADVDFVESGDVVLSVVVGGESVAYPVRQMAYHHVVQDIVGGKHLVATY